MGFPAPQSLSGWYQALGPGTGTIPEPVPGPALDLGGVAPFEGARPTLDACRHRGGARGLSPMTTGLHGTIGVHEPHRVLRPLSAVIGG